MPSSPRTPTRYSGSLDSDRILSSPRDIEHSPTEKPTRRKLSFHSISSPVSTKSGSFHDTSLEFGASNSFDPAVNNEGGLGNLADELAEAWDEGIGPDHNVENTPLQTEGGDWTDDDGNDRGHPTFIIHQEGNVRAPNLSCHAGNDGRSLSPPKQNTHMRPRRGTSDLSDYDGSDYGNDSDLEDVDGISTSLGHHLAAIESLARRGMESNGSGADKVVTRVAESLRELGSQAGVEAGATRLITAYTAIASNLTHQTRLVQTVSHYLISPFSTPPTSDEIDALLPLLASAAESLPQPNPRAVPSLDSLHRSAADLIATLSALADTLHMLRQSTSLASRKLKATKDIMDELKREADLRDQGIRWVERGNWNARLSGRECKAICGDVVAGFRDVCDSWEETIRRNGASQYACQVAVG
ncbi:MAG: hypothetical protein Q9219_000299 [cf. Caloplaca sp. 3 TL-2023]